MSKKKIVCLDFDRVLHSYESGWEGASKVGDLPVPGAKEFLREAIREYKVQIYSSRSNQPGGIQAMKRWCVQHFGATITVQLSFPTSKPSAHLTLDDRALTFCGVWPSMATIESFRPWNKPEPRDLGEVVEEALEPIMLTEAEEAAARKMATKILTAGAEVIEALVPIIEENDAKERAAETGLSDPKVED